MPCRDSELLGHCLNFVPCTRGCPHGTSPVMRQEKGRWSMSADAPQYHRAWDGSPHASSPVRWLLCHCTMRCYPMRAWRSSNLRGDHRAWASHAGRCVRGQCVMPKGFGGFRKAAAMAKGEKVGKNEASSKGAKGSVRSGIRTHALPDTDLNRTP